MASIELKNVVATKDGKVVLKNLSLKIEDGEYIGLLGPTGAGPSHTLKVIAGILPIESGKLLIDGKDVTNSPPEDRDTGFVFEQFNLFPHKSVLENVLYGPRMKQLDIGEKTREAQEILQMVRLDGREEAFPSELSGGMQQRVGIARAVVAGSKILLLDQPYRALDAKIKAEMRFEIAQIVRELGLTALHSTHETEEAMMVSDRIAIFNKGELQQIGTPEEIYEAPANRFVASFLAESNMYSGTARKGTIRIGEMNLETGTDIEGEVDVVIRQHAVELSYDGDLNTDVNIFGGTITKIRVLGEFIRFNVQLRNGVEIVSRQLLALEWRNPMRFMNRQILIGIHPDDIKVYPK